MNTDFNSRFSAVRREYIYQITEDFLIGSYPLEPIQGGQTFTFTKDVTFEFLKVPPRSDIWRENNNTLGIIRINTPQDIKLGPFSHEIFHFHNK